MSPIEHDWHAVHATALNAADLARRRNAARRIADWLFAYLTRVVGTRLTEWFDWDRLRVNVAHRVSPSTVRWS